MKQPTDFPSRLLLVLNVCGRLWAGTTGARVRPCTLSVAQCDGPAPRARGGVASAANPQPRGRRAAAYGGDLLVQE